MQLPPPYGDAERHQPDQLNIPSSAAIRVKVLVDVSHLVIAFVSDKRDVICVLSIQKTPGQLRNCKRFNSPWKVKGHPWKGLVPEYHSSVCGSPVLAHRSQLHVLGKAARKRAGRWGYLSF